MVLDNGSPRLTTLDCNLAVDADVADVAVFLDQDRSPTRPLPIGGSRIGLTVTQLGFYFRPWKGDGGLELAFERTEM